MRKSLGGLYYTYATNIILVGGTSGVGRAAHLAASIDLFETTATHHRHIQSQLSSVTPTFLRIGSLRVYDGVDHLDLYYFWVLYHLPYLISPPSPRPIYRIGLDWTDFPERGSRVRERRRLQGRTKIDTLVYILPFFREVTGSFLLFFYRHI